MLNRSLKVVFFLLLYLLPAPAVFSATNQYGETGLLSVASCETIGEGNLCFGVWGNISKDKEGDRNTLMPASLTFGMSKDLEINVSYPSLLFNGDTDDDPRGYTNIGFKQRIFGTNRSRYKLAISGSMLKPQSSDPNKSGKTDYEGKLLLGVRGRYVKFHLNAGYREADTLNYDNETFVNGALDASFHPRYRTFLEVEWRSGQIPDEDSTMRYTPGFQIFISPYLTFTGGVDFYQSDAVTEQRIIAGVSTCGGLGEYIVPVPKPPKPIIAEAEKPKGKPPIPILPKMITARREKIGVEYMASVPLIPEPSAPVAEEKSVSDLEVPLTAEEEEVVLPPVAPAGLASVDVLEPVNPVKGKTMRKFRLPELMFDTNRWTVRPESLQSIGLIARELPKDKESFFLKIEGHTDSIGSAVYNEKLSLQRASAVAEAMIEKYGVPPERVFIEGYGEGKPIASNETPEGRSLNRRVDVLLVVPNK